jgi:hypothetical protein
MVATVASTVEHRRSDVLVDRLIKAIGTEGD